MRGRPRERYDNPRLKGYMLGEETIKKLERLEELLHKRGWEVITQAVDELLDNEMERRER